MENCTDCTGRNHKTVKGTILRNSEESEECSFLIGKNVLNHKILVRKNVEYTIDLIGKNVVNYIM